MIDTDNEQTFRIIVRGLVVGKENDEGILVYKDIKLKTAELENILRNALAIKNYQAMYGIQVQLLKTSKIVE